MALTPQEEYNQLILLKRSRKYVDRNLTYFLLRKAFAGIYRWPDNWPGYKPKLVKNLIKPIVLRSSSLLMGKGFQWQMLPKDQSPDERARAKGVEHILNLVTKRSGGIATFTAGAQDASMLGDAVFKTYVDEEDKWPKVSQCIPDFFYGLPTSSNYNGELAKVFYAWYMDPLEAKQRYESKYDQMKNEMQIQRELNPISDMPAQAQNPLPSYGDRLRIPVVEVWTKKDYLLIVGGVVIYNDKNPYGFVPFTSIPNIRISGQVEGQSDTEQVLTINEELNQILSHRAYIVRRWQNPTLVWKGAPQNYASILADVLGGGGAIPARIGADLGFLNPDGHGAEVDDLLQILRQAALENANTNEVALTGAVRGSVNTGNALDRQLLPVSSSNEDRKRSWEIGLARVAGQLLELTQHDTSVKEYGTAMVPVNMERASAKDMTPMELTSELVGDYRDAEIIWPDAIAGNDVAKVQTEIMKFQAGTQSLYTTMEKTGILFPYDEIDRMKEERTDTDLNPATGNDTLRAMATAQSAAGAPGAPGGPGGPGAPTPGGEQPMPESPASGRGGKSAPQAPPGIQIDQHGNPIVA